MSSTWIFNPKNKEQKQNSRIKKNSCKLFTSSLKYMFEMRGFEVKTINRKIVMTGK